MIRLTVLFKFKFHLILSLMFSFFPVNFAYILTAYGLQHFKYVGLIFCWM